MWRILLADDHGIYRKGLHLALQRAFPDADLLTADSLPTILSTVEENPDLDLLIIDLHMPHRIPIEGLCSRRCPARRASTKTGVRCGTAFS